MRFAMPSALKSVQLTLVTVVLDETVKALEGGYAGVIADVRLAQQILGQEATFNLGIAENKTAVGEFARNSITMLGQDEGHLPSHGSRLVAFKQVLPPQEAY